MGNPQGCPEAALHHHATYIWCLGATNKTLLSAILHKYKWNQIQSTEITDAIRAIVYTVGPYIDYTPTYVSTQYLQAKGEMLTLMAWVDLDTIRLVGGGGATQCSVISIPWQNFSRKASLYICFNMAITRSSRQSMPKVSAKQRQQVPAHPPHRGLWGSWYRINVAS